MSFKMEEGLAEAMGEPPPEPAPRMAAPDSVSAATERMSDGDGRSESEHRMEPSIQTSLEAGAVGEAFAQWLDALCASLAPEHDSFCLRLTDDRELQELNLEYRGRDKPTDVLSFPGELSPEGKHLGDVVISIPTATRQAEEAGHSVDREVRLLTLHGLLHCLGYDHEQDSGEMHSLEAELRERWLKTS